MEVSLCDEFDMAIKINRNLTAKKLLPKVEQFFHLSGQKILSIEKEWRASKGTPVFTEKGKYTTRGWTEWTQGFQFGSAILQFDATGDQKYLDIGYKGTLKHMASHVSHVGVHDHGFNNISTYGNLRRIMREGKIPFNSREIDFYELALKVSGAVQAARWTSIPAGGFIYSFNGPHSLFVDTIRSLRVLAVGHQLGHSLMGEKDKKISLLERLVQHAKATADHCIYYGKGRDHYDICGRTAHESIFNLNDGSYRCPNSQQGYSPFSTWTRGLAWAICGFSEELEFFMALKSCYECNKEISTKAVMCPQCGAPQNPVSGLMDKTKGFFSKKKKAFIKGVVEVRNRKEIERRIEEDLEKICESNPSLRMLVDHHERFFHKEKLYSLIDIVKDGLDSEESTEHWGWKIEVKLEEIRKRKKEESKTILSRFRPK